MLRNEWKWIRLLKFLSSINCDELVVLFNDGKHGRNNFFALGETIFRKKTVRVPPQDGSPVSFLIRPTTLGNIDLRMTAKSATAGDSIVRQLLVKVRCSYSTPFEVCSA